MSSLLWNAWSEKRHTNKPVASDDKKSVECGLNTVDHDGDDCFTGRPDTQTRQTDDQKLRAHIHCYYGSQKCMETSALGKKIARETSIHNNLLAG